MTRFSVCFNKSLCVETSVQAVCSVKCKFCWLSCVFCCSCAFSPPVSFDFDWCFKGMCVSMALLPVPGTENKHCATKEAMKWELGHWGVGSFMMHTALPAKDLECICQRAIACIYWVTAVLIVRLGIMATAVPMAVVLKLWKLSLLVCAHSFINLLLTSSQH